MTDHDMSNEHDDHEPTQGDNPGAQGDIGAGQGDSGDPVAQDNAERNPDSGDVAAGETVLDEGKVTPDQNEVGGDDDAEHAADEREDPGAPPAQGEPAA